MVLHTGKSAVAGWFFKFRIKWKKKNKTWTHSFSFNDTSTENRQTVMRLYLHMRIGIEVFVFLGRWLNLIVFYSVNWFLFITGLDDGGQKGHDENINYDLWEVFQSSFSKRMCSCGQSYYIISIPLTARCIQLSPCSASWECRRCQFGPPLCRRSFLPFCDFYDIQLSTMKQWLIS